MNHLRTLGRLQLTGADGCELRSILSQPRRVALLAHLALASPRGFHRRDTLLALFWPEADTERARGSLRTALSALRRSLPEGALVNRGLEEVGIEPAKLWCDAAAFEEALAQGELERAVELYRGDLLEGFYIAEAPGFERWLEERRAELRQKAAEAAWRLAEREEAQGREAAAAHWARRAVALARDDEHALRRLLALLDRVGDRAGALRAYEDFAERLRQEYEVEPAPETQAVIRAIRARAASAPGSAAPAEPLTEAVPPAPPAHGRSHVAPPPAAAPSPHPQATVEIAAPEDTAAPHRLRVRLVPGYGARLTVTAAVLTIALAVASLLFAPAPRPAPSGHRVVVAPFENRTGDASLDPLGAMAADWISQGLMRTGLVEVVPITSALHLGRAGRDQDAQSSGEAAWKLARETGATIFVSGAFYRDGDSIHFHSRIADARTAALLGAVDPVAGAAGQPLQAVEALRNRITGSLAARLDWRLERLQSDAGSPPSWEAYHASIQGIEAFINLRFDEARTHFRLAAELDPTYAPGLIFAAINHSNVGEWAQADSLTRVLLARRQHLAPPDQHIVDWLRAYLDGDRPAALRSVRQAVRMVPSSEWSFVVGQAALHANHPAEAVATLTPPEAQRGWAGQWVPYWRVLTASHHMLGQYEQELREVRRARQHHPQSLNVLSYEIRALAALGALAEVERLLEESLLLKPEAGNTPGSAAVWAAQELRAHGHEAASRAAVARALAWYRSRPAAEQESAAHRFGLAAALYEAERWQEARALLLPLVAEQPENFEVRGLLGVVAARSGDRATAEQVSAGLADLELPYQGWIPWLWRARIAASRGDPQAALALLAQAFAHGLQHSDVWHADTALQSLQSNPVFQSLLRPKG